LTLGEYKKAINSLSQWLVILEQSQSFEARDAHQRLGSAYNSACWAFSLNRETETALPYCEEAVNNDPGSASPILVKKIAESFDLSETGVDSWKMLWSQGGIPRSYLAANHADSAAWREGFIHTYLERDIPQLGITIPAPALRRFWTMLAHYHGQTWNASVQD